MTNISCTGDNVSYEVDVEKNHFSLEVSYTNGGEPKNLDVQNMSSEKKLASPDEFKVAFVNNGTESVIDRVSFKKRNMVGVSEKAFTTQTFEKYFDNDTTTLVGEPRTAPSYPQRYCCIKCIQR
jgi:hypothetical protein